MKKTVYRLEQALTYWEDFCFSLSMAYQILMRRGEEEASGLRGLLVNYPDIRKSMLRALTADAAGLSEKYVYPIEAQEICNDQHIVCLPHTLLSWSRCSRRVFEISADLQVLLDATSLEGVLWGDVKLPFETFVVTLGQPLVDAEKVPFDCVIVSQGRVERNGVTCSETIFIPLDSNLEKYRPFDQIVKARVAAQVERGELKNASNALEELHKGPLRHVATSSFTVDNTNIGAPVLGLSKELAARMAETEKQPDDSDPGPLFDSVLRIVAGLCLYLKSLPANDPQVSNWNKPEASQSRRGQAITNEAEVCMVSSQFKLSLEEKESFGGKPGESVKNFAEKCCHFRRGTWCRPIGHGDDPTHPRTVWRRPTLVRPDKLVPGELPKGASTILLT